MPPTRANAASAARFALIERGEAWTAVAAALGAARAGSGSVVLLEGPGGMGKSALIAAVARLAREAGMHVLTATGRRRETHHAYGVMTQLMEGGPWQPPRERVEPAHDDLQALYTACSDAGAEAPLAVLVDDADLADAASLDCLHYLTERLSRLPMAAVISAGAMAARRRPEPLREIARHPTTARCKLAPLSRRGTARRVAKRWPGEAAEEVAAEIHEASGGNPFLVDALAEELARQGDRVPRAIVSELAPVRIAEWALARASEVDPSARALLEAIAILRPASELRHVVAMVDTDVAAAAPVLDTLAEIGILAPTDTLAFSEPAVAAAIEAAQSPRERAAMHLRAASLLLAEGAAAESVAHHLVRADRTGSDWVVDVLSDAAAMALARGAPASAVKYLRRALEEPPHRDKRPHLVLELGQAEAIAGVPDAARHLTGAVHDRPDEPETALAVGRSLFALGEPTEALAAFERGLQVVDASDSVLTGRLDAARATALWLIGLPTERTLHPSPPPESADTPGDRAVLALHAMEGAIRGEPASRVRELAMQALAGGALLDDETSDGLSYYLAAGALAFAEDLSSAEAALTAAVQDARERGSVLGFATASHVRALTVYLRGRLSQAADDARLAAAVSDHGWRVGLGGARYVLASVCIEQGELDHAVKHLDAATGIGGAADPFRPALLCARGRVQLFTGDADGALESFLAAGKAAESAGIRNPAIVPWRADAGLATAVVGDWAEAAQLIEADLALARSFGAPGSIGRSLRALASIRAPDDAVEILQEAVETLETSQAAYERAAAMVDLGASHRRSGRRREALRWLREGLDLAERCGASVLVRRAMRELNVAGARPRRAAMHGRDALTARELQVASLAAEGLSNREIAERLVVTVKTVEWHLRHAYTKLDVSSRRELTGKLELAGEAAEETGQAAG